MSTLSDCELTRYLLRPRDELVSRLAEPSENSSMISRARAGVRARGGAFEVPHTALGGGKVEKLNPADGSITKIFHTDATQVQAWERFKFIDQGNCWYYMQTVSGKYVGLVSDHNTPLLSTDLDEGQFIELVPRDLNYHYPHYPGPPAEQ